MSGKQDIGIGKPSCFYIDLVNIISGFRPSAAWCTYEMKIIDGIRKHMAAAIRKLFFTTKYQKKQGNYWTDL